MNFDEPIDGFQNTRINNSPNPSPQFFEEHSTNATVHVDSVEGLITSGADFETSVTAAVLRPTEGNNELFWGRDLIGISVWTKPESTVANNYIVTEGTGGGQTRLGLLHTSANQIRIFYTRTDGITRNATTSAVINDGVWNHIVLVLDLILDEYEIYHNGILVDSDTALGTGSMNEYYRPWADGGGIHIGALPPAESVSNPSSNYDGVIDLLSVVVDKRINATHANEFYNSGLGIAFIPTPRPSVTFQVVDSTGKADRPVEATRLQDTGTNQTTVDLFSQEINPESFFELQFMLSGTSTGEAFFGPTSIKYATTDLADQYELSGLGFGSLG